MPHFLKLLTVVMIASMALVACGPSGGDGTGGEAPSEEAAPTEGTDTQ